MIKKTAPPDDFALFTGVFSEEKSVYSRAFYLFGVFAVTLIFLTFLTFFLTFLGETTEAPSEVKITNISDRSVTVTWKTNQKTRGSVVYTVGLTPRALRPIALLSIPSNYIAADQFNGLSQLHSVTLNNLTPDTAYIYRISTGLRTYKIDANDELLPPIKTSLKSTSLNPTKVVHGQVVNQANQVVPQALVYLSLTNEKIKVAESTVLSTLTDNSGFYQFNLSGLLLPDLSDQPIVLPETKTLVKVMTNSGSADQIFPPEETDLKLITIK